MPKVSTSPGASAPEAIALKSTLSPIVAAAAALAPVPDRQTIARIVEQVFTARGIPRRGTSDRRISRSLRIWHRCRRICLEVPASNSAPSPNAPPAPHPIEVAEFLSENDVRMALTRNRKLYIGPKTILTPSARDLGNEHDIFIMTDIVPATKKRRSRSSQAIPAVRGRRVTLRIEGPVPTQRRTSIIKFAATHDIVLLAVQ